MRFKLIALGYGMLGVLLALSAWHIWQDHQNLHGLINLVVSQSQAAKKAQP